MKLLLLAIVVVSALTSVGGSANDVKRPDNDGKQPIIDVVRSHVDVSMFEVR